MTAAVMAFLMGGFCFTAQANVVPAQNTTEILAGDNWDKLLDEYEKYVDQYIKVSKKASNGDLSAMTELVKLADKIEKIADKLDKADDEMSAAQMKRYLKIVEKMAKAMGDED